MVYLDNAATTPISQVVRDAMRPFFDDLYGNPSSVHQTGRAAKQALEAARRTVARALACDPHDLVWTSGGTEADGAALFGAFLARKSTRAHIVVSPIEHHAVLHTIAFLESLGAQVTWLPVDKDGRVRAEDVLSALRPTTCLVSIMAVNNEIGTIQPIDEIAHVVKTADPEVVIHSDMVQALPSMRISLAESDVDLASFSAHKIYGPKGIGALYVRKHTPWVPYLYGGNQELKRRGGTENIAGVVGFAAAVADLTPHFDEQVAHIRALQGALWASLSTIPGAHRLSPEDGAPTILNVAFDGVRNDILLMRLDMEGIQASAGSACTAGSLEPSHVIAACHGSRYVREAIRFSLSSKNTLAEIEQAARVTRSCVEAVRERFTIS